MSPRLSPTKLSTISFCHAVLISFSLSFPSPLLLSPQISPCTINLYAAAIARGSIAQPVCCHARGAFDELVGFRSMHGMELIGPKRRFPQGSEEKEKRKKKTKNKKRKSPSSGASISCRRYRLGYQTFRWMLALSIIALFIPRAVYIISRSK